MKTYEGKTEEEVVQNACLDLGVTLDQLTYEVIEKREVYSLKKSLLNVTHKIWYKSI